MNWSKSSKIAIVLLICIWVAEIFCIVSYNKNVISRYDSLIAQAKETQELNTKLKNSPKENPYKNWDPYRMIRTFVNSSYFTQKEREDRLENSKTLDDEEFPSENIFSDSANNKDKLKDVNWGTAKNIRDANINVINQKYNLDLNPAYIVASIEEALFKAKDNITYSLSYTSESEIEEICLILDYFTTKREQWILDRLSTIDNPVSEKDALKILCDYIIDSNWQEKDGEYKNTAIWSTNKKNHTSNRYTMYNGIIENRLLTSDFFNFPNIKLFNIEEEAKMYGSIKSCITAKICLNGELMTADFDKDLNLLDIYY